MLLRYREAGVASSIKISGGGGEMPENEWHHVEGALDKATGMQTYFDLISANPIPLEKVFPAAEFLLKLAESTLIASTERSWWGALCNSTCFSSAAVIWLIQM